MKKKNYIVSCKKNKLILNIKKEDNYINKKLVEIIYKRKELKCYEK